MKRVKVIMSLGLATFVLMVGCAEGDDGPEKVEAAHMEPIGDSGINRVILTEEAVGRLAVETVPVGTDDGNGGRKMSGAIVAPSGMNGSTTAGRYVEVHVTDSELAVVDTSVAALVWPADAIDGQGGVIATPAGSGFDGLSGAEGTSAAQPVLYYEVADGGAAIVLGSRVVVEVPLLDADGPYTVVPYSAVVYDIDGHTWVYVNPEPLVFQRHEVVVGRIDGDVAYLSSGPEPGTAVVKTGVAELFGVEAGVGGH